MKLRIRENTLRLRLQRREVRQLLEKGFLKESIRFDPKSVLSYAIRWDEEVEAIDAEFHENAITVRVPTALGTQWAGTDQVGLHCEKPLSEGKVLRILIEKDFHCLKPRSVWKEDESDAFPNPHPTETCGHG